MLPFGECPECGEFVLDCRCMSRPEKKIDWKRVDELLEAGCLGTEIASYFCMHSNTFYDRVVAKYKMSFTDYSTQKRCKGDAEIREAQYNKAIKKHDNSMLIWLGKQRLGQKENQGEHLVSEEIMKHYADVMSQLTSLQLERKMAESNNNKETKSA